MYYRWLMGNSLAHLEAARGTKHEEEARLVLKEVGCPIAGSERNLPNSITRTNASIVTEQCQLCSGYTACQA